MGRLRGRIPVIETRADVASRRLWIGLGLAALVFVALRALSIPRVAFNWDEFAFFDAIARTLEDGRLRTGGRPGLAQLLALPLVDGCSDEIAVGRIARGLWLGITLASLAGLFALLSELFRTRRHRFHDAALGVALIGLLPAFLEWSLQVRTDQLAIAGGLWGGVALLGSERRRGWALLAGVAFGLGWLSSQKLAYVAALVSLLAVGHQALAGGFDRTRETTRGLLLLAGLGTVLLCFRATVLVLYALPENHPATHVLSPTILTTHTSPFPFYRATLGFDQYRALLPTLVPHLLLCVSLLGTLGFAARRRELDGAALLGMAVLALGGVVALFHAAAFSYFWMTLGLFPAVAGALAVDGIRRRWLDARPQWRRPAAVALWVSLLVPAVFAQSALLRDTQTVQRNSLAFVHRHFGDVKGFHPEGGPFCSSLQPGGIWFSYSIFQAFEGPERRQRMDHLRARFHDAPMHYIVESFRLGQFPPELQAFWSEHFQPYRDSVFVAGRRFQGGAGTQQTFDLLVPGRYRWIPYGSPAAVEVDGTLLPAGAELELDAGDHRVQLDAATQGLFVLSLDEAPGAAPVAFYKPY